MRRRRNRRGSAQGDALVDQAGDAPGGVMLTKTGRPSARSAARRAAVKRSLPASVWGAGGRGYTGMAVAEPSRATAAMVAAKRRKWPRCRSRAPGGQRGQHHGGGQREHAPGCGLQAEHPGEPGGRGIHREGEELLQHVIQWPGRGRTRPTPGWRRARHRGRPAPARVRRTLQASSPPSRPARRHATPMNGAVHGVATSTASRPEKKLPACPPRPHSVCPRPTVRTRQ